MPQRGPVQRETIKPVRIKEPLETTSDYTAISRGRVPGLSIVHKFGRNPDIDSGTIPEDVWYTGGLFNWETSAAVVSVTSASANDDGDPVGTGAATLTIEGLDANWDEVSETITLNGVSAVTTTATMIRVNRAYITSVGTYHGSNDGDITGTINGNTAFTIEAGQGQTQVARYTVPNGKEAYLLGGFVSVQASKELTVELLQYRGADDVSSPYDGAKRIVMELDGVSGEEIIDLKAPLGPFPAKTDLWWTIPFAAAGTSDAAVDVDFELLLVDTI